MFRRHLKASVALATSLLFSSCGGGATNPTSPTSPTVAVTPTTPTQPSTAQWQIALSAGLVSDPATNIRGVEFLLDGTLEQRQTFTTGPFEPNVAYTIVKSVAPGAHTLAIRITDQVRTPGTYQLVGIGQFTRGRDQIGFQCPSQRQSVATGGQLTCSFTLAQ